MKLLKRLCLILLCLNSFLVLKTAEQPKTPSFIILAYSPSLHTQSSDILKHLTRLGLLHSLSITSALYKAGMGIEENFIEKVTNKESIEQFLLEKPRLSYAGYFAKGTNQERLNSALIRNHPIIIICDSYGTKILQDTLKHCPDNAIHSIILLDPAVYLPLNYKAISHRVYNFYSKRTKALARKYTPETGGFIVEDDNVWSKIVNIRCMYEVAKDYKLDVDLSNTEIIKQLNIPALIALADEHYRTNWDLAAIISRASGESTYADVALPLLFINRPLTIQGDRIKNEKEKWTSERMTANKLAAVREQLNNEERYHNAITTCQQIDAKTIFVPRYAMKPAGQPTAYDGISLITFVKSKNPANLQKDNFKVIIDDQKKEAFSSFVFLGQNILANKETWMGQVPYFSTISADPFYYGILKFRIPHVMWPGLAGKRFSVQFKENSLGSRNVGFIPTIDQGQDINFIAFADVQKQNQGYALEDPHSGSALYSLAKVLQENEARDPRKPNSLYLVVGDLVRNGKNLNSWMEVLSKLSSISSNNYLGMQYPYSLLATAIGTHDFADVDWGLLSFYKMIPTYGYLFNFSNKEEDPAPIELEPQQLVNTTHSWFDRGRVRFIHLPYTTEEEDTPQPNPGDLSGWAAKIKEAAKSAFHQFAFKPDQLIPTFVANLNKAVEDRNTGIIDFIVVYGHAPLATAPQFTHMHQGLFNSWLRKEIKTLEKGHFANILFHKIAQAGVDLYLSGHNHQYDRCEINYSVNNGTPGVAIKGTLQAVTLGLGNVLRKEALSGDPEVLQDQFKSTEYATITSQCFITEGQAYKYNSPIFNPGVNLVQIYPGHYILPAYLKCSTQDKTLRCQLLTEHGTVLDQFEVQARR
jgi:hypothetical protein